MAVLATIQHHSSGTEGDILTICHIWSDTGLELIILGVHLEDAVSVQTIDLVLFLFVFYELAF